jgi:hypothetical protein
VARRREDGAYLRARHPLHELVADDADEVEALLAGIPDRPFAEDQVAVDGVDLRAARGNSLGTYSLVTSSLPRMQASAKAEPGDAAIRAGQEVGAEEARLTMGALQTGITVAIEG